MPLQPSAKKPRHVTRRAVVRWIKRGLLAALGIGIVGAIIYAWLPKPVSVDVGFARRIALDVEVAEEGQTRVRDRYVVSAPISGTLQRIDLDVGTELEAGAVIGHIEPPAPALLDERTRREAQARLAAAIAHQRRAATAIARAEVARDAAVREAERARRLFRSDAISGSARDDAELAEQFAARDLAAAQTERASAAAEAAAIRAQLGEATPGRTRSVVKVTSPVRGNVLRVMRDSAGPIAVGAPLVEVGDLSAMEVVVDVLSSDAARIRAGMPVSIEAWGGERDLAGEVKRVEPSAFTRISALGVEEQRVNVIVGIREPPPALGDGFRVGARIFTWRGTDVLAVPASAVFRHHGRWSVYRVDNGRARLQPIEVGRRGRLDVEVVRGLSDGDAVVAYPSDRIRDGVEVARYSEVSR
jgi:HlyD family secretion protein